MEQPRSCWRLGLRGNLRQPRWWWWCWRWWWCTRQLHATSRSALQRTDHPAVRPGVECRHARRRSLRSPCSTGSTGCPRLRRRVRPSPDLPIRRTTHRLVAVVVVVRLAVVAVATRCRGWPVAARTRPDGWCSGDRPRRLDPEQPLRQKRSRKHTDLCAGRADGVDVPQHRLLTQRVEQNSTTRSVRWLTAGRRCCTGDCIANGSVTKPGSQLPAWCRHERASARRHDDSASGRPGSWRLHLTDGATSATSIRNAARPSRRAGARPDVDRQGLHQALRVPLQPRHQAQRIRLLQPADRWRPAASDVPELLRPRRHIDRHGRHRRAAAGQGWREHQLHQFGAAVVAGDEQEHPQPRRSVVHHRWSEARVSVLPRQRRSDDWAAPPGGGDPGRSRQSRTRHERTDRCVPPTRTSRQPGCHWHGRNGCWRR